MDPLDHLNRLISFIFIALILIFTFSIMAPMVNFEWRKIKWTKTKTLQKFTPSKAMEYTDVAWADSPHLPVVKRHCTGCHSNRLILQNRSTREGWQEMIRWMQETQGLWELGTDEVIVLEYLSTYYAPQKTGRRAYIDPATVEWYVLEE